MPRHATPPPTQSHATTQHWDFIFVQECQTHFLDLKFSWHMNFQCGPRCRHRLPSNSTIDWWTANGAVSSLEADSLSPSSSFSPSPSLDEESQRRFIITNSLCNCRCLCGALFRRDVRGMLLLFQHSLVFLQWKGKGFANWWQSALGCKHFSRTATFLCTGTAH